MTDTRSPSGRRTLLMAVRTEGRPHDRSSERSTYALGRGSRSVRREEEFRSLGSMPSLRDVECQTAPPSWKPGRRCPTSACQPKELKPRPQEK